MIRSVAALFAKKTAVVAVSGVVILGGATLALAEDSNPPAEDPPCVDLQETPEDECATDTSAPDESCDDDEAATDVDECATAPSLPTDEVAEEPESTDELPDDELPDDELPDDELVDDELVDDEEDTEEPAEEATEDVAEESHGDVVSEAARITCWEQAYLDYYGNHGQCVKTFAHGAGLTLEELEAAVAARDAEQAPQVTQPADDGSTPTVMSQTSKPGKGNGKGKPASGGNGGGKGGGKGNGKKG